MQRNLLVAALLLTAFHPKCSAQVQPAAFNAANCAAWNITTIAGGNPGDGWPASAASIITPFGLWVANGAIFVADSGQGRIRRVDPSSGVISTVAGTPNPVAYPGDGGPATEAGLSFPAGIVTDAAATTLWIAELHGHRVRQLLLQSGSISTYAGNGTGAYGGDGQAATSACLQLPMAVAMNPQSGALAISDSGNHRIRSVAPGTGVISTIVGTGAIGFQGNGGAGTLAFLNWPSGITWTADGVRLFIADTENNQVRVWDAVLDVIFTFAGTGCVVSTGTLISTGAVLGDGGPATAACVTVPSGISFCGGVVIVSEFHRLRAINLTSGNISTIAGDGLTGTGETGASMDGLNSPVCNGSGSVAYVADSFHNLIRSIQLSGLSTGISLPVTNVVGDYALALSDAAVGIGAAATSAFLLQPAGLLVLGDGSLLFTDSLLNRVMMVDAHSGNLLSVAGAGSFSSFGGDGGPATAALLAYPRALASDGIGGIFIADDGNNRVRHISPNGTIATVAGSGSAFVSDTTIAPATSVGIGSPYGVAFDPQTGLLVMTDYNDNRALYTRGGVGANGGWSFSNVSLLAGDGGTDFEGNDGPALSISFSDVLGITLYGGPGTAWPLTALFCTASAIRAVSCPSANTSAATTTVSIIVYDSFTLFPSQPAIPVVGIQPVSAVLDVAGNLIFLDHEQETLYFVANALAGSVAAGVPIALAGSSSAGSLTANIPPALSFGYGSFCGDGGDASLACLQGINGVAVSPNGSVIYVADGDNRRVRKIWCTAVFPSVSPTASATPSPSTSLSGTRSEAPLNATQVLEVPPPASSSSSSSLPLGAISGIVSAVASAACILMLLVAANCFRRRRVDSLSRALLQEHLAMARRIVAVEGLLKLHTHAQSDTAQAHASAMDVIDFAFAHPEFLVPAPSIDEPVGSIAKEGYSESESVLQASAAATTPTKRTLRIELSRRMAVTHLASETSRRLMHATTVFDQSRQTTYNSPILAPFRMRFAASEFHQWPSIAQRQGSSSTDIDVSVVDAVSALPAVSVDAMVATVLTSALETSAKKTGDLDSTVFIPGDSEFSDDAEIIPPVAEGSNVPVMEGFVAFLPVQARKDQVAKTVRKAAQVRSSKAAVMQSRVGGLKRAVGSTTVHPGRLMTKELELVDAAAVEKLASKRDIFHLAVRNASAQVARRIESSFADMAALDSSLSRQLSHQFALVDGAMGLESLVSPAGVTRLRQHVAEVFASASLLHAGSAAVDLAVQILGQASSTGDCVNVVQWASLIAAKKEASAGTQSSDIVRELIPELELRCQAAASTFVKLEFRGFCSGMTRLLRPVVSVLRGAGGLGEVRLAEILWLDHTSRGDADASRTSNRGARMYVSSNKAPGRERYTPVTAMQQMAAAQAAAAAAASASGGAAPPAPTSLVLQQLLSKGFRGVAAPSKRGEVVLGGGTAAARALGEAAGFASLQRSNSAFAFTNAVHAASGSGATDLQQTASIHNGDNYA